MTTPTLPRVVTTAGGRTIYAMASLVDGTVCWTPSAGLLQAGFRWADERDHIPAAHLDLDLDTVIELICISKLRPAAEPTPRDVRSAVLLTLDRVHCDRTTLLDEFSMACWDSPRMLADWTSWAREMAGQLIGGVA